MHSIFQLSLLVKDYDEAIKFYTEVLEFKLIEDTVLSKVKRWVVVAPKGGEGCRLLLAKAKNEEQEQFIGNQTGGRVFLFIHTHDLDADYKRLTGYGVNIVRGPVTEEYGKVLVFEDLYGNKWDLIERGNVE